MSVDSHSTTIVFCEGKGDSLDSLLLKNILPVGKVRIQPIGGKHSLPAYIQGYIGAANQQVTPNYVAFRDRDFDKEPETAKPALLQLRANLPIYMCYRAAIENYLIDVDLIYSYWAERQATPKWQHGPVKSRELIAQAILESARELSDYQAIRWALAKLKPGNRWPEINTTWIQDGSGNLPQILDYSTCITEAKHLVESFRNDVQGIDITRLETFAEEFRQRFTSSAFLENQGYLIWFHGKDLMKLLCKHLSPTFPRRNYLEWAAQHIDIALHPDLQDLLSLIP